MKYGWHTVKDSSGATCQVLGTRFADKIIPQPSQMQVPAFRSLVFPLKAVVSSPCKGLVGAGAQSSAPLFSMVERCLKS